jgi:pyruvate kinase
MPPYDGIRSQLEWNSTLNTATAPQPTEETKFLRKTSIIATIGPKTNSVEKLAELRRAGVNIVRMNFSHGEYTYHQSVIDNTRAMVKADPDGRPVAIALDTVSICANIVTTGLFLTYSSHRKDLRSALE